MIDLGLTGKRAIVSGAGFIPERAGHGRQSSLKLAEAGATVACIDIDEGRAKGIVAEIESIGGTAIPVVADMTDRAQAQRAVDEAVAGLGGVDVAVDIIGKASWSLIQDVTPEEWQQDLVQNITQVFDFWQIVSRHMITQGTGALRRTRVCRRLHRLALPRRVRSGQGGRDLAGQDVRRRTRALRDQGQRRGPGECRHRERGSARRTLRRR